MNDFISGLASSLEFNGGEVLWHDFLNYIVYQTSAISAELFMSGQTLPCAILKGDQALGMKSQKIRWDISDQGSVLELEFTNRSAMQEALKYWDKLSGQIKQIFSIGLNWQEKNKLHELSDVFCVNSKMGFMVLNIRSEVDGDAVCLEALIQSKVISLNNKKIRLSDDPDWLAVQQERMLNSGVDYQTAYKSIESQDGCYRCVLIFQKNSYCGWKLNKPQFIMLLYPQSASTEHRVLKDIYNISDSEAEVAALFSKGLTAEEVARITGYTTHTVYSYIKKVYSAIGVNKQAQLTAAIWPELVV